MQTSDAHAFNRVILSLYREGREVPLASFQAWALEQIAGLFAFDSAWWGSATAQPSVLHEMHLHNCGQEILEFYPPHMAQDVLRAAMVARPGTAVNLSDLTTRARHVRSPLYRECGRQLKLEWALGTLLIEPVSLLNEFLILWRHDPGQPFSDSERQTKELLMPHLVEAHRAVRLRHFLRTPADYNREWALANTQGLLREASPAFLSRLREHWPGWSGNRLPEPLASMLRAGEAHASPAAHFHVTVYGQLRYLQGRPDGALEQLSQRQREIALRYTRGETYSAIATALSLSPATVRNHIAHCFKKLGVSNKLELVRRLEANA
ncbi:MAG: helix-turn-helix transcriptional regulator [Candidatus Accumulibacter sp.]|uniref:Helix-turn-helix transcriptional regulator n=1 Tax=Candidatus Accumulibacter affinis TaxID=2954384 RepID=A0A935W3K4_9PROT|nr:helix-turn-helix transcriptional regulator [Candidatus Accumulibacter affinis]